MTVVGVEYLAVKKPLFSQELVETYVLTAYHLLSSSGQKHNVFIIIKLMLMPLYVCWMCKYETVCKHICHINLKYWLTTSETEKYCLVSED